MNGPNAPLVNSTSAYVRRLDFEDGISQTVPESSLVWRVLVVQPVGMSWSVRSAAWSAPAGAGVGDGGVDVAALAVPVLGSLGAGDTVAVAGGGEPTVWARLSPSPPPAPAVIATPRPARRHH